MQSCPYYQLSWQTEWVTQCTLPIFYTFSRISLSSTALPVPLRTLKWLSAILAVLYPPYSKSILSTCSSASPSARIPSNWHNYWLSSLSSQLNLNYHGEWVPNRLLTSLLVLSLLAHPRHFLLQLIWWCLGEKAWCHSSWLVSLWTLPWPLSCVP